MNIEDLQGIIDQMREAKPTDYIQIELGKLEALIKSQVEDAFKVVKVEELSLDGYLDTTKIRDPFIMTLNKGYDKAIKDQQEKMDDYLAKL